MQTNMEQSQKRFYETPGLEIFELKPERVICQSGTGTEGTPTYNGFNTQEETW